MNRDITNINGIDLTKKIVVNSKQEAWNIIHAIFPTDYVKDEGSTERAGYPVFRSTAEGHYYDYICELGERYEVNLSNGKTVNVWFSQIYLKAKELARENVRLLQENDSLKSDLEFEKILNQIHEKDKAALKTRIAELENKLDEIKSMFATVLY